MSMMAPKWLGRNEPAPPALPPLDSSGRPKAVLDFLETTDRMREENAWLLSENAELKNDLKVALARLHDVEGELTHVRNNRDYFCRHDRAVVATLEDVQALIGARLKSARAEAYAAPGSGAQEPEQPDPRDDRIIENLAATLAPERTDA